MAGIGSLNESPLHAALKRHAAPPGSRFEVDVGGYVVDAVAGDVLVEVQTRNLGAMRTKLGALLPEHRVRLVLPIADRRWLVKLHDDGRIDRRRSPKRGTPHQLFAELVAMPTILAHPHFELEVLLTEEEELRRHRPGKAWRRRGWVVEERRLLAVRERFLYRRPEDLLTLVPTGLPDDFTTADVAARAGVTRRLAQQAAYCLTELELIARVGKRGNAHVYRRSAGASAATTPAEANAASTSASSGATTVPLRR